MIKLTAEEMLVVLLDVEYDRARQLHLREQIEVTQDKEHFALRFELRDHELLVRKEVIFLILIGLLVLVSCVCGPVV